MNTSTIAQAHPEVFQTRDVHAPEQHGSADWLEWRDEWRDEATPACLELEHCGAGVRTPAGTVITSLGAGEARWLLAHGQILALDERVLRDALAALRGGERAVRIGTGRARARGAGTLVQAREEEAWSR